MFVYQNAKRDICVTFKSNKPVTDPEYVISIDHEKGTLTVNNQLMVASTEVTKGTTTDSESVSAPELDLEEQLTETVDETAEDIQETSEE